MKHLKHNYGLGGVAIGNGFKEISDEQAQKTLEAAWNAGVRYYDTSPWYGLGLSERRFGHFLHNKNREEYQLSTKIGRILTATKNLPKTMWHNPSPFDYRYDYSAEATRRSVEDSLQRLGVESLDFVFIHDLSPDHDNDYKNGTTWEDHFKVAQNGAMPELEKMKEEGLIEAWGLGVNTRPPILKSLEVSKPDVFLAAIQYSLLDHKDALNNLFPAIEENNAELIIAAPFNSGLLTGSERYNYADDVPDEIKTRLKKIKEIAAKHKVNLTAASLQFSLAPTCVGNVLAGASEPRQVEENKNALEVKIPAKFWTDLKDKDLIEANAPIPG